MVVECRRAMLGSRKNNVVLCGQAALALAAHICLSAMGDSTERVGAIFVSSGGDGCDRGFMGDAASLGTRPAGRGSFFCGDVGASAGVHQCLSDALLVCGRSLSIFGEYWIDR